MAYGSFFNVSSNFISPGECAYKHQKKQRPKVKKFQEKECTEINGTNITHLANFTDLENPYHFFPNKTYNFTATGNYIW